MESDTSKQETCPNLACDSPDKSVRRCVNSRHWTRDGHRRNHTDCALCSNSWHYLPVERQTISGRTSTSATNPSQEEVSSTKVDTSVRGTDEERAAHQLETLENWRGLRERAGKQEKKDVGNAGLAGANSESIEGHSGRVTAAQARSGRGMSGVAGASQESGRGVSEPSNLVISLARELYDVFAMGGWEPQDAYQLIEQILEVEGRGVSGGVSMSEQKSSESGADFIMTTNTNHEVLLKFRRGPTYVLSVEEARTLADLLMDGAREAEGWE